MFVFIYIPASTATNKCKALSNTKLSLAFSAIYSILTISLIIY